MSDFYFERYMDHAIKNKGLAPSEVSASTLIEGIEDIGGEERVAIAKAVPREALQVFQALRGAQVAPNKLAVRTPDSSIASKRLFIVGWNLRQLVDGASYFFDGATHQEPEACALLGEDGIVYTYATHPDPYATSSGGTENVALGRYSPVCATSMNDRAVLYGLASLTAFLELDVQTPAINAEVPIQ